MKRVLCIIIGLNLVGGGKTFADDSLTGLHLGFGLNVVADEYKSDVDVLGIAKYASGDKWTFTGNKYSSPTATSGDSNYAIKYEKKYGYLMIANLEYIDFTEYYLQNDGKWMLEEGLELTNGTITIENDTPIISNVPTNAKSGHLTVELIRSIINNKETAYKNISALYNKDGDFECGFSNKLCYPNLKDATVTFTANNISRKTGKMNSVSGEMKFSYFHNLFKDLYVGIDVSGNISSSHKKNIAFDNSSDDLKDKYYVYYDEKLHDNSTKYVIAEYDNKQQIFTNLSQTDDIDVSNNGQSVNNFFHTVLDDQVGALAIPERTYTILKPNDIDDVTFEKNKFNSKAAVVLGAQYKGWFAGVRGGVSYNQGRLHVKDSTGTSSEEVSFASPFVGVHLMKSVNMKGLENGHIYVTADVNVENKQRLNMRGIKNVKHNSVNVSLGMTWQIN